MINSQREGFCDLGRSVVRSVRQHVSKRDEHAAIGLRERFLVLARSVPRSVRQHVRRRDTARAKKIRAERKNGRFVAEAAKFREETPRKGGGLTDGSVIPRCNNMMEPNFPRKS
jgi:hypothetical protein